MASGQWAVVLQRVQQAFQSRAVAGLSEGQLLDRFVSRRDEVAFEAIVARHGPMVLGVCRGFLHDPHDVDDAFQATFLVLVKKANSLQDRDRLGPWLHGVARRVALRSRLDEARRSNREQRGIDADVASMTRADDELRELQALIRTEVDRLSHHERAAIVTCYLEGLTHEEAAERLGWPVGTVKGRLARARDHLRDRLTRRGVSLPAGAVVSALGQGASPVVPLELIASTTLVATRVAAGQTLLAGIVSAQVATLVQGVIGTMSITKWKLGALAVVSSFMIATPGVVAWQMGGMGRQTKTRTLPKSNQAGSKKATITGSIELNSTPAGSPEEFRALNQKLSQKAGTVLEAFAKLNGKGGIPSIVPTWSTRLLEEKMQGKTPIDPIDRLIACQTHFDSVKRQLEAYKKERAAVPAPAPGSFDDLDVQLYMLDFDYQINEAQGWLAEAKEALSGSKTQAIVLSQPSQDSGFGGVGFGESKPEPTPAELERNKAIEAKLEMVIAMKFEKETPFSEVLKYLKEATKGVDEKPIPIYVDPYGLKLNQMTMASPVVMELEGIPLKTTLRLLVGQLGMRYEVKDGLLMIEYDEQNPNPMGGGGGGGGGMGGMGGGFR